MQEQINHILLIIIASFVIILGLCYAKAILIPFMFSLLIYIIFSSAIKYLQNQLGFPRVVAILTIIFSIMITLALTLVILLSSINNILENINIYQEKVTQLLTSLGEILTNYNIDYDLQKLQEFSVPDILKSITGGSLSFLSNFLLIIMFSIFMISSEHHSKSSKLIALIAPSIKSYLKTKVFCSFLTAISVGILYYISGIDLVLTLVLFTFILNFIPNIGSLIAVILPLPLLIIQFGFGLQTTIILLISLIIQFLIGNFLEPKLIQDSIKLHTITTLFFLIVWGMIWGTAGMFLAVPMTAILKIILDKIEVTKDVVSLLEGDMTLEEE